MQRILPGSCGKYPEVYVNQETMPKNKTHQISGYYKIPHCGAYSVSLEPCLIIRHTKMDKYKHKRG